MRIWDINPGYLNRESLLGEHREVHAIFSIVINAKKGYARHPETLRWRSSIGALCIRHDILVCEMLLRGYRHHSPSPEVPGTSWPETFIDPPQRQFAILKEKYRVTGEGRIPLPANPQQLWAQHKYSVLARDPGLYAQLGPEVAARRDPAFFAELAFHLVRTLRIKPSYGRLMNALEHMWGYVSSFSTRSVPDFTNPSDLISQIQERSRDYGVNYLIESTALSDLAHWTDREKKSPFMVEEPSGEERSQATQKPPG